MNYGRGQFDNSSQKVAPVFCFETVLRSRPDDFLISIKNQGRIPMLYIKKKSKYDQFLGLRDYEFHDIFSDDTIAILDKQFTKCRKSITKEYGGVNDENVLPVKETVKISEYRRNLMKKAERELQLKHVDPLQMKTLGDVDYVISSSSSDEEKYETEETDEIPTKGRKRTTKHPKEETPEKRKKKNENEKVEDMY